MSISSLAKGPNMIHRAVMQHLSLTDWKSPNRLPIPASGNDAQPDGSQGWIEMQSKDYHTVVRLAEAGLKSMRSPIK
jgi:hypothetical protein